MRWALQAVCIRAARETDRLGCGLQVHVTTRSRTRFAAAMGSLRRRRRNGARRWLAPRSRDLGWGRESSSRSGLAWRRGRTTPPRSAFAYSLRRRPPLRRRADEPLQEHQNAPSGASQVSGWARCVAAFAKASSSPNPTPPATLECEPWRAQRTAGARITNYGLDVASD